MTPIVLIHGGASDARCWERLVPLLDGQALAVDLPGRGAHPAHLESVTFADCADSVLSDIGAAGFEEVMLVGHSLAGCSMPAIIGALGDRVRHAVFVAVHGSLQWAECDGHPGPRRPEDDPGQKSAGRSSAAGPVGRQAGARRRPRRRAARLVPGPGRSRGPPPPDRPRRPVAARGSDAAVGGSARCRTSSSRPRSRGGSPATSGTVPRSSSTPVTCAWSASRRHSPSC